MIHISMCPYKSLETYLMILVSMKVPIQKSLETHLMILISISAYTKKVWKLFYDLRIFAHR